MITKLKKPLRTLCKQSYVDVYVYVYVFVIHGASRKQSRQKNIIVIARKFFSLAISEQTFEMPLTSIQDWGCHQMRPSLLLVLTYT